ncbi:nuclear distribution protein nudF [Diaporthe amygdali]|uniref:nuclear distribution protein nudF n=1 Tax=Phomopsis amygdali TaxID=1214568 RepID=UPI0022FE1310|nr:nuclear distribution protein nudF [Diaporthe amygdali]KAJ0119256.1 nuclear distribution protein nudF [Diaporthe amygdali]
MSVLTSRQAEELHKSMIPYLAANNLPSTTAAPRTELNLEVNGFDAATEKKYENLLERKWTSTLESWNAALQFELDNLTPASLTERNTDPTSWLPNLPLQYTLESHRNTMNCIAFHPVFSLLATDSDDYTIKI